MGVKVANNAVAALTVAINGTDTTITVDSGGAFFPDVTASGDYAYLTLCNDPVLTTQLPEVVTCNNIAPNGLDYDLTVVRSATTTYSWNIGADIELRTTAELLEDLVSGGVAAVPGYLGHSQVVTASGALVVADTGQVIFGDTALGDVTMTLMAIPASNDPELRFLFIKTTADANDLIVAADAADNIDGSATYTLTKENEYVEIHSIPGTTLWRVVRFGDNFVEAAQDGLYYARRNGAWAAVTEEAPNDGTKYVRQNLGWVAETVAGGGDAVPAGTTLPYAGSTLPTGYLWANGQAVSRTTYVDLFTAIGTAHGIGDGATTFNVPDLRGRAPFGDDTMSRAAASRLTSNGSNGDSGGFEDHTLTSDEMPSHSHSVGSNGSHSHSYTDVGTTGGSSLGSGGSRGDTTFNKTTGSAGSHSHSLGSTGGGSAHNNMPPYSVFNFIIKT